MTTRPRNPRIPDDDAELVQLGREVFGKDHNAAVTVIVQAVIETCRMVLPPHVTPRSRAAILRDAAARLTTFADELDPPEPDPEGPAILPLG